MYISLSLSLYIYIYIYCYFDHAPLVREVHPEAPAPLCTEPQTG